jgi:hypothetical protein
MDFTAGFAVGTVEQLVDGRDFATLPASGRDFVALPASGRDSG